MNNLQLVLIPGPGAGHLPSTVQLAKVLAQRNHRLSITILIIRLPEEANKTDDLDSLSPTNEQLQFIILPQAPPTVDGHPFKVVMESQKANVRDAVAKLLEPADSPPLAGIVLDMFCTTMIDVANEFGVPSYVFFTSGPGYLAFTFHLQELYDRHNKNVKRFLDLDSEIAIPSFTKPIPGMVIPPVFFIEEICEWLNETVRRFRETRGILVNTFFELESEVMNWFSEETASQLPPVYAVGPILSLNKPSSGESQALKWLDEQPPSSVLFLCFGSKGSFNEEQAREMAHALERSGYRFLWSLRRPGNERFEKPSEYGDFKEILPEGFLDRTAEIGRMIGWAPQVEILSHPATGGFVSHCGWNSTLESLWHGVPMGTWPMYAEQHFNAFEMVEVLGLAVEIAMVARKGLKVDEAEIVRAEKIENGVRKLMDGSGEMRKLVKLKSEEMRKSVMEGGSSFCSLNSFIEDLVANCP